MEGRAYGYAELRREGLTRRDIRVALDERHLIRARRDRYVAGAMAQAVLDAARLGGRLDCVSLARHLGVFVLDGHDLHVQMTRGKGRVPVPPKRVVRHWRETAADEADLLGDVVEALAQAVRCQPPRAAIATLDSAWHAGVLDEVAIAAVFARLPARFQILRAHLDPRSEAGSETVMRLLLRSLGCSVEVQREVRTVGRVDLIADGWLIIECDSRAHHASVEQQVEDRRRDLSAAALGYVTFRVLAEDILYRPDRVIAAIRGILASARRP